MCRPVTLRTSRPWRNSLCTLSQGRPRLLCKNPSSGPSTSVNHLQSEPYCRLRPDDTNLVDPRSRHQEQMGDACPTCGFSGCCRRAPAQPPLCSCLYALPESLLKCPKTPVEVLLLSPGNMREENRLEAGLCGNPALRGNAPRSLQIPAFPQISLPAGFAGPASSHGLARSNPAL